jgi:hypothetical protein
VTGQASSDAAPSAIPWDERSGRTIVYANASDQREEQGSHGQKVQTIFIDDLDGSQADGTVRFGLDGTDYEIDLNAEHSQQLGDVLARHVDAARRISGSARRSSRTGHRPQANGLNTTEVREWAKAQGIDVKDRGRVPAELIVKFKAATEK